MTAEAKPDNEARLDEIVERIQPSIIQLRRYLHMHPELGWQEFGTQRHLKGWLSERGMRPVECANTGLYVDIGEDRPGAPILYRGDIDALPIFDEKSNDGVPYASQNDGVCHACGHDAHASMAAGIAAAFHEMRDTLPSPVRVVFQPAEEVAPSGAEAMVMEGVARGVRAGFAVHVDPMRDVGTVGVKTGPLTSATDNFSVDVIGQEGHSARPYLARDAVLAAADIIRALYMVVPQRVDPLDTAVLNVGIIRGGEAKNVISGKVHMAGVVRCLNPDIRQRLHMEMREVAQAAARVHGCSVELIVNLGSPSVMNDSALCEVVRSAAADVLGDTNVQSIERASTGAEDFGTFGIQAPIFMARLGCRVPGEEPHHLHTSRFDIDERALSIGMRVMGRSILRVAESDIGTSM